MGIVRATTLALLVLTALPCSAQSFAENPDLSACDNCPFFPAEWLQVDASELIDLSALPPERRLDFLIGEWELLFPYEDAEGGTRWTTDQPVGFEIFDWFRPAEIIEAYQEWPFTSGGGLPFRAKSDLRYIEDARHWQLLWVTTGGTNVYTGGLRPNGAMAFQGHRWSGEATDLRFEKAMLYVFRNITPDRFVVEMYASDDDGRTYDKLSWRMLYRRRQ